MKIDSGSYPFTHHSLLTTHHSPFTIHHSPFTIHPSLYYIAHVLPPELDEEIRGFKAYMRTHYGCKAALKSPAHITFIAPFRMDPVLEEGLKADLDACCRQLAPVPMSVDGFSGFKPRTLFIQPLPSPGLHAAKEATDAYFSGRRQYDMKPEQRRFHPHITIANRDLSKDDFPDAWAHFEQLTYRASWTAGSLSLLRHNAQKNWDVVHTSQFSKTV